MKLYIGRVVSNTQFPNTGYIDVVLPQTYEELGAERLLTEEFDAENLLSTLPSYDDGLLGDGIARKCRIFSPIGTGENYGMFTLPQVNSVGLVAKIDYENDSQWGSNDKYFWLGGVYGGKMYGAPIVLPNDDTDSELLEHDDEPYISGRNTETNEIVNTISGSPYENEGMFLIKLKTCETPKTETVDDKTNEKLHYKFIPCNDEFVMRKSRVTIRYNEYGDDNERIGISDLTFNKEKVKLSRFTNFEKVDNKDDTRIEQYLIFDDKKVKLEFLNKKNKVDRSICMDDEKVEIKYDDPDKKNNVTIKIGRDGKINVYSSNDANVNIGGNANVLVNGKVEVENKQGCKIKMDKKISISNKQGNLYTLLHNLYKHIPNMKSVGSEGEVISVSQTWSEFAIKDISTLDKLME